MDKLSISLIPSRYRAGTYFNFDYSEDALNVVRNPKYYRETSTTGPDGVVYPSVTMGCVRVQCIPIKEEYIKVKFNANV